MTYISVIAAESDEIRPSPFKVCVALMMMIIRAYKTDGEELEGINCSENLPLSRIRDGLPFQG